MKFVHIELKRDTWMEPEVKVKSPDEAVTAIQKTTKDLDREMLICIYLSTSGRVISASVCSVGSMDQSIVSPAEIMRTALAAGARSIILIHNHPSGECVPSTADEDVTKRMACVSAVMGIDLLDHIILGDDGSRYSFKENQPDLFEVNDIWNRQAAAAEHRRSI